MYDIMMIKCIWKKHKNVIHLTPPCKLLHERHVTLLPCKKKSDTSEYMHTLQCSIVHGYINPCTLTLWTPPPVYSFIFIYYLCTLTMWTPPSGSRLLLCFWHIQRQASDVTISITMMAIHSAMNTMLPISYPSSDILKKKN